MISHHRQSANARQPFFRPLGRFWTFEKSIDFLQSPKSGYERATFSKN